MKWCEHCNVSVNTERKICPLCFNSLKELDEKIDYACYPKREKKEKKKNLLYKTVCFICIISILISLIVDFFTHVEGSNWWSLYVVISVFYVFSLFRGTIYTRIYAIKRLIIQEVVVSILLVVINLLSSDIKWALSIVIPCVFLATNSTNMIIMLANKKYFGDNVFPVLLSLLLGCVPFILELCDVITGDKLWAPLTSFCYSIVLCLGIFIFGGKLLKEEFSKRFHV